MNNNTIFFMIAIVPGECTMLIQQKRSFKACVIWLYLYSTHYKVNIHIPCIKKQRQTTESFYITHVVSSSNRWTPRLYQLSDDSFEGDHNADTIRLLQPSQTIHYCNQSMLAIFIVLIYSFEVLLFYISFREAPWYSSFILCASYLYNSTGNKVLQF